MSGRIAATSSRSRSSTTTGTSSDSRRPNSTIQSELPTLVAGKGGNYEWWFVGRDSQDGKNGEALGIAYDPDRFELSDRHYFWLSPTPDEMSYGWDEVSYHRIACCAVVTDKAYGKQFFMMVTHMPLADMARSEAAKVIIEREQMYNTLGMPSVLVGDMMPRRTTPLRRRSAPIGRTPIRRRIRRSSTVPSARSTGTRPRPTFRSRRPASTTSTRAVSCR